MVIPRKHEAHRNIHTGDWICNICDGDWYLCGCDTSDAPADKESSGKEIRSVQFTVNARTYIDATRILRGLATVTELALPDEAKPQYKIVRFDPDAAQAIVVFSFKCPVISSAGKLMYGDITYWFRVNFGYAYHHRLDR